MEGLGVTTTSERLGSAYRWVVLLVFLTAFSLVYMTRLSVGPLAPFVNADLSLAKARFGPFTSGISVNSGGMLASFSLPTATLCLISVHEERKKLHG